MINYSLDFASLALLLVVGIYFLQKKHITNKKHTLLRTLIIVSACFTVFDMLSAAGMTRHYPVFFVYLYLELCYYAEGTFSFLFMLYVFSQLEMPENRIKLQRWMASIPIGLISILLLLNPFTGWVFTYSAEGGLQRGILYFVLYAEYLLYFIWSIIYATLNRRELTTHFVPRVHTIATINIIPTILQFFLSEQYIKPFFPALSIVILWFEQLNNEEEIDVNTGLSNYEYMCQTVKCLIYNKISFRIILVRIADYDLLNTSYGIENTDKLSDAVARYLSHWVGSGSSFKYGSAAFALIFRDEEVDELEKKVYTGLNHIWHIDELDMTPSFFVTGIPYPEHLTDLDDFIAHASFFKKMHRTHSGIVPEEELHVRDRLHEARIINALRNGLDNGDFYLHYQPIYDIASNKFVTAEVLSRLNDPDLGNIPPMEFIPLAEENGLIIRLGYQVIEEVCRFIRENDLKKLGLKYIELNLSVVQCLQHDFVENLMEIVNRYEVDPPQLCLEITETASNCAPETFTRNLRELKNLGFLLALDDYGTGYANLERMVQNDFDFIKFDKGMIQRTLSKKKLLDLYFRLQNIFHSMGSKIVAEGVENQTHYEILNQCGCDYIQGYYFSKPLSKEEFVEFITEKNK